MTTEQIVKDILNEMVKLQKLKNITSGEMMYKIGNFQQWLEDNNLMTSEEFYRILSEKVGD